MATAVPSRFAVLAIEDDDFKPKKATKPASTGKTAQKNKGDKQKQQPKKDDKKKQSKGKKKKNNADDQQWEQWKQKDSMAVEETYEQDLHQAILLSKIDMESQNGTKPDKEQDQSKKGNSKKSKKSTIMSLEEFNNMGANSTQNSVEKSENAEGKAKEADPEYFERIQKEINNEITKGKEKDFLKARLTQIDDDDITSAKLKVELEKKDDLIKRLKEELIKSREELEDVKSRNQKLCQMLGQGEMKDKAAVLAEVNRLQEIRDELTAEVTSLHAQLEQERSKNHALNAETNNKTTKQNSKKRLASENA